ncbi:MAG TPA: hypothetical protein VIL27_09965 [Clostridia bacterium]
MSNFLNQFEDGNYKKRDMPPADLQPENAESPEMDESIASGPAVPASAQKPAPHRQTGIHRVEHDVVIDSSYGKVKIVRYLIVSFTVIALCVLFFFGYRYFNSLQMLGFVGKNLNEARTWGLKNRIELDIQYAFDTQSSIDIVISQDITPGTTIQKGTIMAVLSARAPIPTKS